MYVCMYVSNTSGGHETGLETGDKIVFAPLLLRFWNRCIFHIHQLIVRARSRLCWSNIASEDSFILSLGICSLQD